MTTLCAVSNIITSLTKVNNLYNIIYNSIKPNINNVFSDIESYYNLFSPNNNVNSPLPIDNALQQEYKQLLNEYNKSF